MIIRREALEKKEEETLAPYASLSSQSRGRLYPEPEDEYRTCFQRDRDRIIHSSAFRRLQFKTQVFLVHEGDFYRTRLTHTLEVMQISRGLARNLGVNEDLTEAIALAHDLGHTPFGHAGEEVMREITGGVFDHNLQSLRIIEKLEKRYPTFPGINPTWELREGLAKHITIYDTPSESPEFPEEFRKPPFPSVEAQIVNISDVIAFCAHDLDDALRIGLARLEELPSVGIPLVEEVYDMALSRSKKEGVSLATAEGRAYFRHALIRNLINKMVMDVTNYSRSLLADIKSPFDARQKQVVGASPQMLSQLQKLAQYLYQNIYMHPFVVRMVYKAKEILRALYKVFCDNPKTLPVEVQERMKSGDEPRERIIVDFLASLTDRQAMDYYQMLFEPYEKILGGIEPT